MNKVREEIKKKLLDYPFVTRVRPPQAPQIAPETAKSSEKSLNPGVDA